MTKTEKLIARLIKAPPPSDFTFDELCSVLISLGFEWHGDRGGSHGRFVSQRSKSDVIFCARPHPKNVMGRGTIRNIVDTLRKMGYL
ncbi:type II toxin-antitoxin system HicA family toxin [Parasutterella excrementihominis]